MNIGILALVIAAVLLTIGASGELKQSRAESKRSAVDINRVVYNCPVQIKEIF